MELEVATFFSVYKYYEKLSGKNSGHLEVIWPPHWMMANFLPNRPPRGLNRLYSRMVQDIDAIFCQTPAFMLYYVFFTSSMHKPCISGYSIFLTFFFISKKMFFFFGKNFFPPGLRRFLDLIFVIHTNITTRALIEHLIFYKFYI